VSVLDSFGAKSTLTVGGRKFEIFRLDALERRGLPIARLPYSLKVLLENLLRREDGRAVRAADIERLARWDPRKTPDEEIAFMPARVLLRTSRACPPSWISPPCATRSGPWAGTRSM
jgi:aconitate hydratase